MPRLRQVPRSEAAPSVLPYYDMMFGDRDPVAEPGTATGSPGDWWTVLALVPDILDHAVAGFGLFHSPDRALPPQLRELVTTRVGWALGSQMVFSQHCKSCRTLGLAEDQIAAIPHWQVAECFTPLQRAALAYADALAFDAGRVADGVFDALRAELSDEAILELTYATTMYVLSSVLARALRTDFDDRVEPVVEVPAPGADQSFRT